VFTRILFVVTLLALGGCISTRPTPTPLPAPTLPAATGIPVTPRPDLTMEAQPTATVETLPTPDNVTELFATVNERLAVYTPPETDPTGLYSALAFAAGEFLARTANGDVSMEGQPALVQLRDALEQIQNLPENAKVHVTAIHTGDDQGGSRDLILIAIEGVMGLPVIGVERLGATFEPMPPIALDDISTPDARYFFSRRVDARDMTGDGLRDLLYEYEFPGASGTTNQMTVARWLDDEQNWKQVFRADLINWAGESGYEIETAADSTGIRLFFPWFGAFDHKLLMHPNATQTWEYNQELDRFVRLNQTIEGPRTPRQAVNAGEYAFRNGDLEGALDLYERAWNDPGLEQEDFSESRADTAAFGKFRQVMILNLLGRGEEARRLLTESQASGDALASLANTYARNLTGNESALRGWIAMANAGDLYNLIYEGRAGNLDFPFEAREIYAQGGIVSSYLNTHPDADRDPEGVWNALDALGFKPLQRTAADLNGDGTNEFLVVTQEGGTSPNQSQALWFIYQHEGAWRVRSLDLADIVEFSGETVPLADGKRALLLRLIQPTREQTLAWDGMRITWLDGESLEPRADPGTYVGGGILEDDF
jgi:hypothetical protein